MGRPDGATSDDGAAAKNPPKEMSEADEEEIRARLREAGWDKAKILKAKESERANANANANANGRDANASEKKSASNKEKDPKRGDDKGRERERERDRDRDRGRDGRSGRGTRRSRSARRRDKDRDRRRDRDRGDRDRGSRRHRSRSASKSRSRSASAPRSSRRDRDRGRERGRPDKRRSRSVSKSRSRSRSASKSRGSKRSRRGDAKTEDAKTTAKDEEMKSEAAENVKGLNSKPAEEKEMIAATAATNGETEKDGEHEKNGKKHADDRRSSHKSSRHRSRSASRSPSRSHRRRRRHRSASRSRSASRGRRGRGSSRSRSRSHSRRHRSSRRRGSRSRSRSRSRSNSRRHRSKSRERSKRDANSSPQPHQFPPPTAAVAGTAANPLNPSITQLMQQYPTMSLQDIIAKMQASNVTMAAAVSMKPARELYVGNLPASVTGPQLQEFLGTIIQQVGLTVQPGNPILSTWISTDGHFAFCEMRSIEECNMALMLNQLPLLGQPLKFGRPKSFMGPPQPMPVLPPRTQTALTNLGCTPNTAWFASPSGDLAGVPGMTAALSSALPTSLIAPFSAPTPIVLTPESSSNKLIMSNIPVVLTEDQVKELVEPFGVLKSFEFVKDPVTLQPTGSALFEYADESVTEDAKNGLDGLDLGGIPLVVKRAVASDETGPVLRMANMVSIDELKDDEEFADLKEDVEEECKRFGSVVTLEIPRPVGDEIVPGLGDIFVHFSNEAEAAAALKALSGRKFGGNIVKVSYFPLAKLEQKNFA